MSQPPSSHIQDFLSVFLCVCVCDGGWMQTHESVHVHECHMTSYVSVQPHVAADVAQSLSSVMCCPLTFSNV